MKKFISLAIALLVGLFALAACSNDTVADISTPAGGEVVVTASDAGTVEEEVTLPDGTDVDAQADYETLTITYTAPSGYTETADGGGLVTFTLDGSEVGKILYLPETVSVAILNEYYTALQGDAEALQAYAAQYAEGLDVDYEVTTQDVNGQEAIFITGTVAADSTEGNPGDVAYVLVMPMGDQLIVIRGFADAATADAIKTDLSAFAGSLTGTPAATSASV